jgi:heme oxygenase
MSLAATISRTAVEVSPDGSAIGARSELRRLTNDIHLRLHDQRDFKAMSLGLLEMPDYIRLLQKLYGFHFRFESALRSGADALVPEIDLVAREKSPLLREDLISLGLDAAKLEELPLCSFTPDTTSAEGVIGSLYVIEGAGLGGKILARNLDYLFGGLRQRGRQFFKGRPNPDPLPWARFCDVLENRAAKGDFGKIVSSALATFYGLEKCLNEGSCND